MLSTVSNLARRHVFASFSLPTAMLWIAANGLQAIPSTTAPASTPAHEIQTLAWFTLSITGGIFFVVAGLLTYAVIKYRAKASDPPSEPAQIYGSTQIELAWTVIPVLIVVVLFLTTARVILAMQDAPEPASALDVTVIGHQFWWEFRYPELGIVTANELHVPVSDPEHPQPTYLTLLSADVAHSFWVPQLAGKTDLIPNHLNTMWIDPQRGGTVPGPVRAILRNAARQDAAARLCRYAGAISTAGCKNQQQPAVDDPARRRRGGTCSRRRPASTATRSPARRRRALRARSDAPDEPRHDRLRRGGEHAGKPARVDSRSRRRSSPARLMPAMQLNDQQLDQLTGLSFTLR